MNSVEEVYVSGWAGWWRKYSLALQIGTTISCNVVYFVNAGYTRKAITTSMILLGGASLYCFFSRRRKINARDLIIITGCNSGLGYSLAMHCRAKGATVLAGVRETATTSNSNIAVETLENKGILTYHLDITNEQSVLNFRKKVESLLEERQLVLRTLVNNAGVMVLGEFEWQTQKLVENQVNVNLLGTMKITQELMPILRKNRSRIIVVSSHCADESLPGLSIYGATKAALNAWATSLRVEVGKYGIEVVSFIPGQCNTPIENHFGRHRSWEDAIMKVLASACIIFAICIATSLQETPYGPCYDGPTPRSLRVEGCNSSPCNLYRGTDLIAQWDFVANADAKMLKPRVKVTIMGTTIDYPYPEQDACKSLTNGECPLSEGDEATYNLKMEISELYPSLTMTIEFGLIDENDNVQVCFNVVGKVTDK